MINLIQHSDFVGKYQIAQNIKLTASVTSYIAKYQTFYMYKILGVDLAKLFFADSDANDGVPTEARFLVLWNALAFDDDCGIRSSVGLKEVLIGFIYFEIVRDSNFYNTLSGNKKTEGENNSFADMRDALSTAHNISTDSVKAIQWYICNDPDGNAYDYSEYNGQECKYLMNF